ncbi:MAG: hypothetical protein HC895_21900 [Leptolyngbyaceae cyanobacterium SM1_3_5]|nr:hypothetical protein [Leptolyngbyaceae cyanobacterium SM1_3_5]
MSSAGGITEQFARSFFPDVTTAATLFQKYGAAQEVLISVQGLHSHTNQAIDDRFVVLEATNNDVLGESLTNQRLYKIGTSPDVQIRPNKIKTELGDRITITADTLQLQELAVTDLMARLPQNAYLSGSLVLDDIAEVQLPLELESFSSLRVFGGQVELANAKPSQLEVLREFWILSGKLIVKVRS